MPKVCFNCIECGKTGEHFPSQPRKFCSLSCRSKWQSREHMPTKPRRGETFACPVCGTPVYRSKGETTKRFCSQQCNTIAHRKTVEKVCPRCGDTFSTVPSTNLTYCSRHCYELARTLSSTAGRMHNGRHAIRDHSGYIRIWEPDHPAASQGRVLEHRWVVEQALGRILRSDEHVHHVNGVKDDNRSGNLRVLDAQEHRLLTAAEIKDRRADDAAELAEYRRRFGPLT